MNLERLLRSPLTNATMYLMLGTTCFLLEKKDRVPDPALYVMVVVVLASTGLLSALVYIHNVRHPDRRIRLISIIPPEFREEDEGQQWLTYRVTRRVYMMYCTAVPLVLAVVVIARDGAAAAIVSLTLLGIVQQIMYWREMRKWEKD